MLCQEIASGAGDDHGGRTLTNPWRALRRRILTPGTSATRLDVRGFYQKSPAARDLLETIGHTFLTGYAFAAESQIPGDAEERLERIPTRLSAIAYQSAAMCFAVSDGLALGHHFHV